MRPIAFGLVVAMVAAALVPAAAVSQGKKAKDVPAAARKRGMEEAPAVVQGMGVSCQVTDARFAGESRDPKTKASNTFYEVDCASGPGFILQAAKGQPTVSFSCIEANTSVDGKPPSLPCILPGNADPKADLVPLLQKAKTACTPTAARGIGQTKTNSFLEVSCREGAGFIIIASTPLDVAKDVEAQNCLNYDEVDSNVKCTLSDKATRLAVIDNYVAAAKNNCAVKERRFVGGTKDGSNYFETSCQDGKGYIYKVSSSGQMTESWDCARATAILGGCTLTDARQAATEQAALYTRLAKSAGSNCEVEKYAIFPTSGNRDIVELVCKGSSGGVGFFEASGKGSVLDCAHALVAGYKCGLNTGSNNDSLTADLRKHDVKSCTVSNSRIVGKTAKGTTLLEVACSDGLKGYMLEYSTTPTVTSVGAIGCAFAAGCKLPGNT